MIAAPNIIQSEITRARKRANTEKKQVYTVYQ